MTLTGSSFADSSPLVMALSNAELVVGAGNSFNFSGSQPMSELLRTDTPSLLTYSCDSAGGCQLRTSAVASSSVCLAGSAGAGGVCQLCSPGKYTDLDDQAECRNCSGGFYQPLQGQTTCLPCPLGHACPNGTANKIPCAAGSYADETKLSECKPCEAGRYCPAGSFKGLLCAPGFFSGAGASHPSQCPAGRYGSTSGLNSSDCSGQCEPGHYCLKESTSAKSEPCPAGTYNGSYGLDSAAGCAACPAGTSCPVGSARALECAPGTVRS